LINVLFSDALARDFVSIGDAANWQMLDTGKAGNDKLFWEKVQRTIIEPGNLAYNCLQFIDDDVFCDKEEQINPALIVNHNWKNCEQQFQYFPEKGVSKFSEQQM
jgi:hypothetical protein